MKRIIAALALIFAGSAGLALLALPADGQPYRGCGPCNPWYLPTSGSFQFWTSVANGASGGIQVDSPLNTHQVRLRGDGVIAFLGSTAPAAGDTGIGNAGSGVMTFNVPTAGQFNFDTQAGVDAIISNSGMQLSNGSAPAATTVALANDGSNDLVSNAPTGRSIFNRIAGSNILTVTASGAQLGAGAAVSSFPYSFTLTQLASVAGSVSNFNVADGTAPNVGGTLTIDTCSVSSNTLGVGTGACSWRLFDNTGSSQIGTCSAASCSTGTNTPLCTFTGGTITAGHDLRLQISVAASNTGPPAVMQCTGHF